MSRTHRYSGEEQAFRSQAHRISRRGLRKARQNFDYHLPAAIGALNTARLEVEPVILVDPGWVPNKKIDSPASEMRLRDQRLDLLQTLGEQMLAFGRES